MGLNKVLGGTGIGSSVGGGRGLIMTSGGLGSRG